MSHAPFRTNVLDSNYSGDGPPNHRPRRYRFFGQSGTAPCVTDRKTSDGIQHRPPKADPVARFFFRQQLVALGAGSRSVIAFTLGLGRLRGPDRTYIRRNPGYQSDKTTHPDVLGVRHESACSFFDRRFNSLIVSYLASCLLALDRIIGVRTTRRFQRNQSRKSFLSGANRAE
jgi:hypothetical protein